LNAIETAQRGIAIGVTVRGMWRVLCAIAVVAACGKKSNETPDPAASANDPTEAAEGTDLLERGDKPADLSSLAMPAAERDQLAALAPDQILALSKVTSLDIARAKRLATFPGKVLVLMNVGSLDANEAEALAAWSGDALFLGLTSLDLATAAKLALWKGKHLHLDHLETTTPAAAKALATFGGTTLGLARLAGPPDAFAALATFQGFVAISLGSRAPAGTPTGSPPSASTPDEIATLSRMSKAVDRSDVAMLREYLAGGGSPDINEHGTTLLMEATNMKQLEPAKLLVEAGANVNAVNQDGKTPLYYALDDFQMPGEPPQDPRVVSALVHLLVDKGAKVEPDVERADDRPLAKAAKRGDGELVKYLISKGADPKRKDARGATALIAAINAGNAQITKALIEGGAGVNVDHPGPGASPLHQAISQGSSAIGMARYENKGAKIVAGLVTRWLAVVDAVIAGGANVEARDDRGWSALEYAINGGAPEILKRVLDTGPKLDASNDVGRQPLHFLADLRRLEEPDLLPLAKLLVARGADKKAKTPEGKTAADLAADRGFKKLAAALR